MTVSSTTAINRYVGTGLVSAYAFTFKVFEESDLLVQVTDTSDVETTLTLTTDYTVVGEGLTAGGTITLVAGVLTSGYIITISRALPLKQLTDIRNQGEYYPELHEDQFDRSIMIDQQQQDDLDRAIHVPNSVDLTTVDLQTPSPEATSVIGWNAAATGLVNYTPAQLAVIAATGTLANGKMWIGNASSVPTPVTPSGGFTIDNLGVSTLSNSQVIAKVLTAYASGSGVISASDSILTAVQKLNGNQNAQLLRTGVANIGIKYTASTFSVCAADGTDFSATNIGYVSIPSNTAGQVVTKTITSNVSFLDSTGSSNLIGEEFGTKSGTAWSNARPFYLYALLDSTSALFFGISACPSLTSTPSSSSGIGYKGNPSATPSDVSMWVLGSSLTTTNFTSRPCIRIGGFRMTKNTSDDWAVGTLANTIDGIRPDPFSSFQFIWVAGEAKNTVASSFFNSASAPAWATPTSIVGAYYMGLDGYVNANFSTINAGNCTNGASAGNIVLCMPFAWATNSSTVPEYLNVSGTNVRQATVFSAAMSTMQPNSNLNTINTQAFGAVAMNSFSNAGDDIRVYGMRYEIF